MPDERPNVLLLCSDEHSFRCLGHRDAGGEPTATPTFDRLAREGTNFETAYCQMPLCTPSRLCMLTGRDVVGAEAWGNSAPIPADRPTIPGVLSEAGYDTSLVGKMHLGWDRQFAGFDDRPYGDLTGQTGHQWEPLARNGGRSIGDRIADAGVTEIPESHLQEYTVLRESLAWIRDQEHDSDDPWFLTASFSRPHFPLTAPRRYVERYWDTDADEPTDRLTEPPVGRSGDTAEHPMTVGAVEGFETADVDWHDAMRARACYFAAVEFLDAILGELLATMERDGLLENTVVIYTSDHGELAGEHGLWWKHTWHEAATRVPLFVETPAHRAGDATTADVTAPVSLADLFPTIAGLTGVEAPADLDGVDLSATIDAGTAPDRGPVFCDNPMDRWGEGTEFRVVRDGRYKYVGFRDAPELLFDVEADPMEQTNLAPDASGEDAAALERLRDVVAETIDFEAVRRAATDIHEDADLLDVENEVTGSGNCYFLNGQVVDADVALYDPRVIVEDPEQAYADYPTE
jgi:choline-sulfatase